jgi:urease accessory protein
MPMLYRGHYLGNIHTDARVAERVARWRQEDRLEDVTVRDHETRKSRLRLQTSKGREIGLILSCGSALTAGDVYALEGTDAGILIHLAPQEVMVLRPRPCCDPVERIRRAVRLGHVLGNQHWPLAVVGAEVLVPVIIDTVVMETVLRTHHVLEHFSIRYERRPWPQEKALSHQHSAISQKRAQEENKEIAES